MPSRRTLPVSLSLMLALLVLATGCVTVRAPGPAEAPGRDPAPAGAVWAPRQPVVRGLPLGRLPEDPPTPETPGAQDPAAEAAPAPAAPHRPARTDDRPPRRTAPARSARPARPAHRAPAAAPAAKPRTREPARPEYRPAPQRTYDMAPLCEAARGRVDPAIVALCH
ncbi:hypothetical protein [Streptomyces sp. NBC_00091]|uniref:hypothetical protein n=1 Tax=Streptomyces sp. NBC_00091 TaxID=2975648 RepID=UPI00224D5A0B|nr:hypothetical protein [Streptomyces sp. NBC_00091]MCX5380003.1 hypothetical protein [Streptomyces sp. NBC_00091]